VAYTVDPIQLFLKQQILTDTNTLIEISSGPDSFDSILLEDKMGTQGMLGTVLEGMDERTNDIDDGQIVKKIRDTEAAIKPENSLTHPLEASPPSPFESDDVNNTKKPLVIAANSSMSVLSIGLDSNDKGDFRLEQLFICPIAPNLNRT
jgi:hypothetical protein